MQNPLVIAPNGAICCKLWPQTVLGWGPQILGGNPFLLGNPSAPGAGYEGFKVALGWHGAPFGDGLGSGPHFPRKCPKIIMFYTVWEPARVHCSDPPDLPEMVHDCHFRP